MGHMGGRKAASISDMGSVTRKKSPNDYKSGPKMISLEKMIDFDKFTKIVEKCRIIGQINICQRL